MDLGKIIFLNGTSSAGKTTIARALLDELAEHYVHTGIDQFLGNRSQHLLVVSDGRPPGGARFFHAHVHAHGVYDLQVDTAAHTPEQCARQINQHLQTGPAPLAFRRLHRQQVAQ